MRQVSERSRNVSELAAEVASVRAEIRSFRIELRAVFERFLDTRSDTRPDGGARACAGTAPVRVDGRSDTDTADDADAGGERCQGTRPLPTQAST